MFRKFRILSIIVGIAGSLISPNTWAGNQNSPYRVELQATQEIDGPQIGGIEAEFAGVVDLARSYGWQVEVAKEYFIGLVLFDRHSNESISDLVVRETQGCERFDIPCRKLILDANRLNRGVLNSDFNGTVALPAKGVRYTITIDAGSEYRVEEQEGKTIMYISSRLNALTNSVGRYTTGSFASFCSDDSCHRFERVIIDGL